MHEILFDAATVQSHFPSAKYIAESRNVENYWYVFDHHKNQIGCYFTYYNTNPDKIQRQKIERVWSKKSLEQIYLQRL